MNKLSGSQSADAASEAAIMFEKDKTLLIVDDDKPFLNRLSKAMSMRGFLVTTAESVTDGLAAIEKDPPAFAIIDMRLG